MNTIRMSNCLDPDQDGHSVGHDVVQTVCKGYQQMTKVTAGKTRLIKQVGQKLNAATDFFLQKHCY